MQYWHGRDRTWLGLSVTGIDRWPKMTGAGVGRGWRSGEIFKRLGSINVGSYVSLRD
jgi:hypothetical protein